MFTFRDGVQYQETKKQKVLPSAYTPGNTAQPMKTVGPEVGIVYSWTLSTLYPTADQRWDSDRMMDKVGEKIGLRKGG